MGGFWEISHPPFHLVRVTVKVEIRFIFRFQGGVGGCGWFPRNQD